MSADLTTRTRWDDLYQNERHWLRYPSEHVVRWLASLPGDGDALDIGCGIGRHLRTFRDYGYTAVGCDIVGGANIIEADMTALPFEDASFDAVLAYGVFYYATMGDADEAVHEMRRVMRPGSYGFVSVRSGRDWRADHTDSHGVFHLEGEPEDGMTLDFISEDELRDVYGSVFDTVGFEIAEWTTHKRDRLNSDWLISVSVRP